MQTESTIEKNTTSEEPHKKAVNPKILLRVLLSVIFFIALIKFGKVNVKDVISHLLKVNPFYFSIGFLFYMLTLTVSGTRFHIASKALGFRKNHLQCIQLNFVGTFFNNFLPTTFGGDAMRGYYLKSGTDISLTKAAACLLCERYTGMAVLFWMSSIAFLLKRFGFINNSIWDVPSQMEWFAHIGTFGSIFIIPFLPKIKVLLFGKDNWVYRKIEPVLVYWHDGKLITEIFILSLLLQACVVLCHLFIAYSLNLNIPLSYYFIFYPLTTIAGFLIPSLNGLGVREGSYIFFLSKIGIPNDQGMAFSMGFLVVLLLTSVIGGIIYMLGDFRKNMPHETTV